MQKTGREDFTQIIKFIYGSGQGYRGGSPQRRCTKAITSQRVGGIGAVSRKEMPKLVKKKKLCIDQAK